MHSRRKTVLITGFGPFPGIPANASAELVRRIAGAAGSRLGGYRVQSAVIPTLWREGPELLLRLLDEHQPALALHFGVSSRADGFAIEMRCRNVCSRIPDASGLPPPDACILADGPASLSSTLPVHYIVARLRRLGLPARISHDPGFYLCNALLYHSLLQSGEQRRPCRSGFIHVPDGLVTARGSPSRRSKSRCRMTLDQAVEGGLEIIAASIGRLTVDVDSGRPSMAQGSPSW